MTKTKAKSSANTDTPLSRAAAIGGEAQVQAAAASLVKNAEETGSIDVDRAIEVIGATLLKEPVSLAVENILTWIPADRKTSVLENALEIAFQLAHRRYDPKQHPKWDACTQALNLLVEHNAMSPTEFSLQRLKYWGPAGFTIVLNTTPKSPWDYERILHATIHLLAKPGRHQFKHRWLDFKHRGVSLLLDRLAHEQYSDKQPTVGPRHLAGLTREQLALAISIRIYSAHVDAYGIRDDRFSSANSFHALVAAWNASATVTASSADGATPDQPSFTSYLPPIMLRYCVSVVKYASHWGFYSRICDSSPCNSPIAALLALDRAFVLQTIVLNGSTNECVWSILTADEIARRLTSPRRALNCVAQMIKRSDEDGYLNTCLSKIPPAVRNTREFMYRLCRYNGETGEFLRRRLESGCGWKWKDELAKYGLSVKRDVVQYVTPRKRARRSRWVVAAKCMYHVSSEDESDSCGEWDSDSDESD